MERHLRLVTPSLISLPACLDLAREFHERNGGLLEDERQLPGHPEPVARYWIALEHSAEDRHA